MDTAVARGEKYYGGAFEHVQVVENVWVLVEENIDRMGCEIDGTSDGL